MHAALDVVALGRRLRDARLALVVAQVASFAAALALVDVVGRPGVYVAARAALVTRSQGLAVFDVELVRGRLEPLPAEVG